MTLRHAVCILALLATACTATPDPNGLNAELHTPLTYPQWQTEHYKLRNGADACSISSGYNGLAVILSHQQGQQQIMAQTTRPMRPGTTFAVSTDTGHFETDDTFFSPEKSAALADNLAKGGKAYLEWSELSGPQSTGRQRYQNILKLDDFAARLKDCHKSLGL